MRSRNFFAKAACFVPFLIAAYYIRRQYAFQRIIPSLYVSFSDFPETYTALLNESRTDGDGLMNFDYNATFLNLQIPRIIHFIYFTDLYHRRDGTPSLSATDRSHAPDLCRKFNPDFEIRIWNETDAHDLIATEYSWFLPTYETYKHPIQRVDALKYFALYHFGGIYMDLDIACRRPLEPLLQFPAWFPEASPLGVNNDLMASAPQHPILLEMTRALPRRNQNLLFPYLTIFWSTGPQFASDLLRGWWWKHGVRQTGSDMPSFRILPQIFYSEEFTFFGHSPGGTWHGGDVAVVLWCVERPWVVLGFLASCIVFALGIANGLKRRRRKYQSLDADCVCHEA
ncbi:nucleotide-diphospho-sugar transferase [Boeremia exigua]|uniref:nucleotide-diphospho-sugar transferase n=1 Tax=Boeremia exigua TaxID=749465 RepID=UPI001E8D36D7|nr:nucleotide-diphospho-sugar transferase [Boeremia exigua]KAH6639841.1 nucleotide-diphospho-sugar transferase [Boeremia exigua]